LAAAGQSLGFARGQRKGFPEADEGFAPSAGGRFNQCEWALRADLPLPASGVAQPVAVASANPLGYLFYRHLESEGLRRAADL
jgi:hypothetical protein